MLRYYQELMELKYYVQAGTWYEYGKIVKMFKNISAYRKPIRNQRGKIAKENKLKLLQNKQSIYQGP
jgi:hypothetical protein